MVNYFERWRILVQELNGDPNKIASPYHKAVVRITLLYLLLKHLATTKNTVQPNECQLQLCSDNEYLHKQLKELEEKNSSLKHLFSKGFYLEETLSFFNLAQRLKLIEFIKQVDFNLEALPQNKPIEGKSFIHWLITYLHGNHLAEEVDLITLTLLNKQPINKCLFLETRLSGILAKLPKQASIICLNYDIGRWRENKLSLLFAERDYQLAQLSDLRYDSCNRHSQDLIYLSANSNKNYSTHDQLIFKTLGAHNVIDESDYQILNQHCELSLSFLQQDIADTNLKNYHIIQALDKLNSQGKIFLSVHLQTIEDARTLELRKYLVEQDLIEAVIFVNTNRKLPRLLIILSNHKKVPGKCFWIGNEVYRVSDKLQRPNLVNIAKIQQLYEHLEVKSPLSEFLSLAQLRAINYRLNPTLINSELLELNLNQSSVKLHEIAAIIKRGAQLNEKSRQAGMNDSSLDTHKYFMLNQQALNHYGTLDCSKLIPISELEYHKNIKFHLKALDLVLLAKFTTPRVALIASEDLVQRHIIVGNNLSFIRLKPNSSISARYLCLYLNSLNGKREMDSLTNRTGTSTVKNLPLALLSTMRIPTLDTNEQQRLSSHHQRLTQQFINLNQEWLYLINEVKKS